MPTPISAFAAVCERIAGVDPGDVRAVDDFFLKDFAALDQIVRDTAFNWALSLDQEPTEDDRDALDTLLAAVGFMPRRHALPDSPPAALADENRLCA